MRDAAERPKYPMARDARCPFDPPKELARLQSEASLTQVAIWDDSKPWLVTRFDEVRAVLEDGRASGDIRRDGYPHMSSAMWARQSRSTAFINMDDPVHAEQRRKLSATFSVRRVEAMRSKIQGVVDGLIDAMLAGSKPVDLVEALTLPVLSVVDL
ncbi:hypothetical protein [Streptomyces sp. UG1]|uniref:hypothetical protein n=1 Tax=Streptomyces sp. UG1 TaxID=3417652 RepID=UPI003CF7D666